MGTGRSRQPEANESSSASFDEPRVLMFDDGRHAASLYAFEPPLTPSDLLLNVDQLVGSGVDTLVYSAVLEGGVAMYDSRVAQRWGDNVTRWTHSVWYRAARNIHQLIADGHDPLKLLCERSHEKGIWFIASSWVNFQGGERRKDGGLGRKSDFIYDHPEYQVGEEDDPRASHVAPHRFSFLHAAVRHERFKVFEEMLARYDTDGVELDLCGFVPMCKFSEVGLLAPALTQWLRELREVATTAEREQGLRKRIYARIPSHPDAWKMLGYEVPTWVSDKLVDGLVCLPGLMNGPVDQDPELAAAVALTRGSGCRVFAGFQSSLGRQRERSATPPMIWAAASNAYSQGSDGFALANAAWTPHGWPWTPEEYRTLRILGHPEMLATADKHYHARSTANAKEYSEWVPGVPERLPKTLVEGEPVEVPLRTSDDLETMHGLGRVSSVRLLVRLTDIEPSLNEVRIELNGRRLPDSALHLNDISYRMIDTGAVGPYGYIYDYRLTPELYPRAGQNTVTVTLVSRDPNIDATFEVYDVDCKIQYRAHRNFEKEPIDY